MKRRGSMLYLTREGIKNVWINRLMSIASICVLLSCLVMIGTAFMAIINMNSLIGKIEDQNVVMVFLKDDITNEETEKVGQDIEKIYNIKECVFVPKEQSFSEQIKNLESESASELFQGVENPLPDAYKVVISELSDFDNTVSKIKTVENVTNVRENKELASQLMYIRKIVTYVSIGIIAVLLLVSLFIISNTIRITMFSRRLEIKIMRSVGATSWFVRWPFMIEGMMLGLISGLISLGIVSGLYYLLRRSLGSMLSVIMSGGLVPMGTTYPLILLAGFIGIGVIAGAFGSALTIRKYLKEQEYDDNEE